MAGSGRFDRPSEDAEETAQRVEGEVREAREQVYVAYLRARERGVGLLEDPAAAEDGGEAPERLGRFRRGGDDRPAA